LESAVELFKIMQEEQYIYLVGFSIASDSDEPNFYALYFCYDDTNDRPIALDGEILFFQKPELATSVLIRSDDINKNKLISKIFQEVDMVFDIDSVLYLIEYENVDTSAEIINFLNILFDFVKFTGVGFPENYREYLYDFADHLTFDTEYESFFQKSSMKRSLVIEALYWCLGAIFANSKIIQ
jgi:hypothetical protein